jgi:hypothetical protein
LALRKSAGGWLIAFMVMCCEWRLSENIKALMKYGCDGFIIRTHEQGTAVVHFPRKDATAA